MSTEFDRGIAVSARPDDPTTYDAELDAGWQIGAGVNGGLLLATLGNALRSTFSASGGHLDPVAISAYYLSASDAGPGRRTHGGAAAPAAPCPPASALPRAGTTARRRVERIRALATYGDLGGAADDVRTTATPPDLPPPDACVSSSRRAAGVHGAGRPARASRPAARPGVRRLGARQAVGARAGSRGGCGWPTAASPTRCCCCSPPTRCRRSRSTSGCSAGPRRWS